MTIEEEIEELRGRVERLEELTGLNEPRCRVCGRTLIEHKKGEVNHGFHI